jgi:hypothetical protein
MINQIVYTNLNCSDLWEMFIKQNEKYCKMPLYFISDKLPENYHNDFLKYSNDEPYYKVWTQAAKKFGKDYFIYLQEDFILYEDVNQAKIDEYVEFLKFNPKYSFVRLLKSGNLLNRKLSSTLYEIESTNTNIFSMQPTIWRASDYITLMNLTKNFKWLENDSYRNTMINLNMMGAYHYDGEERGGQMHFNSNVYPYIATALVSGKWNMSEYSLQLNKLFTEYNIDMNKRGKL